MIGRGAILVRSLKIKGLCNLKDGQWEEAMEGAQAKDHVFRFPELFFIAPSSFWLACSHWDEI